MTDISMPAARGKTKELLDDCLDGSPRAWRRLHRQYFPVASAFLRKLGVADVDLEDAIQNVFLGVHRYLASFRRESELSTWLYRLCITQASRARRRRRFARSLLSALSNQPLEALHSDIPEEAALRRIQKALATLPETERNTFVLYEMEGLPGKQVAEILQCTEATVWRRLHYGRRHFREALDAC